MTYKHLVFSSLSALQNMVGLGFLEKKDETETENTYCSMVVTARVHFVV